MGRTEETPPTTDGAGAEILAGAERTTAKQRLGHLLLDMNYITLDDYERALDRQSETGGDIIDVLVSLGCVEPGDLVGFLLEHASLPMHELALLEIPRAVLDRLPPSLVRELETLPLDEVGDMLTVGTVAPLAQTKIDELERTAGKRVRPLICPAEDIRSAIQRYYPEADAAGETTAAGMRSPLRLHHVVHLIQQVKSLPALPDTVHQVQEAVEDPEISIASVVDAITLDPPIAARVLGVANSAAYGFPQRIHDLTLAVSLMGLRETYYLVLSAAVVDVLNKTRNFDYRTFFLNAICCAAASRIVAAAAGRRNLPGIFTAGLLHDVGRAALWEAVPDLCAKLDKDLEGTALLAEEERVIGLSHAEAGYELATHWNLPKELALPIRFHHTPEAATECQEQVAVVALANAMIGVSGKTLGEASGIFKNHAPSLGVLELDEEQAEAMLETYLERHANAVRDAFE